MKILVETLFAKKSENSASISWLVRLPNVLPNNWKTSVLILAEPTANYAFVFSRVM